MRYVLLLCIIFAYASTAVATPEQVSRVVRMMDFEERKLGNREPLPMHWDKLSGPNLPHYVNGHLSTDRAFSGDYSFKFELNGGGLIYRYDPRQVPVQAGCHYKIECMVATTVMPRARARLTAYFADIDLRPIESTIHHSQLYAATKADEPFQPLALELSADLPAAKFLVVELELLQPSHYAPSTLGPLALHTQDIRGAAWFDDIKIAQVPRVELDTDHPGNIFQHGDPLLLHVKLYDQFTEDLTTQLVLRNAEQKVIYQRSGVLPIDASNLVRAGLWRASMLLPELPAGWYSASLVLTSGGTFVGDHEISFVVLNEPIFPSRPDGRFGVIATDLPFSGWKQLPRILPYLGTGRVKLGVWTAAENVQQVDSDGFDAVLESLHEVGITPTACLVDLPQSIQQTLGYRGWTAILGGNQDAWQPQLAYLISRHADHLDRWQLGADDSELFVTDPKMRSVYDRLYAEFANLVQYPDLAMPWPAWYEMEGKLPASIALSVSPTVLPSQIPLYMQDLRNTGDHHLSLSLQLLDAGKYGRDLQIADLAQRVIYALGAKAQRIDLPLPFRVRQSMDHVVSEPQELFIIVRTLLTTLSNTEYRGKVPIDENVEAFLFQRGNQGILALWSRGGAGMRQVDINLGASPMQLDLWGNVTPLIKLGTDDAVRVSVGQVPVFLIGVDAELAQIRASVAFDRPLLESSFKPHTRRLRFTNPYSQPISGTLRLKGPKGWIINPPTHTFNLNPNETFDREITLEFPYNTFAGPKTIDAQFVIQSDRILSFTVPVQLQLGLSDVGMQTMAIRDGNDIIVQQMVTNYGDNPVDYTAFSVFPGQARQERLITNLPAGRTTIKRYRFVNVTLTPGAIVRSGLRETYGSRILNEEVAVQ